MPKTVISICNSERMTPYSMDRSDRHPHCKQLTPPVHTSEFQSVIQHLSFPRKAYEPSRPNEMFSVKHHGQRKLLMSEIGAFLKLDPSTKYTAVYAGNPKHRANHKIHAAKLTPSPACNFLFYPGCGKGPIHIKEIFEILFVEAPALARYILIYLSVIRDLLRLDDNDMETVAMTINHYDPMGAINAHVDTVFIFNGTLGPIFTVAMGPSEKMLDLLPVLLPNAIRPVRLFSKPNEIMLMDGEARTLWAHAKPWNYPHEQFSVVFKFPEFRTKTHATTFEYEGVPLSIPYHYVQQDVKIA